MKSMTEPANLSAEVLMGQIVEEFLERLDGGEDPDIEVYVQQYPQLATVLRQMLPVMKLMGRPGGELSAKGEPSNGSPLLAGSLGDYRIVREIGRGGMGLVYEAVQISLNRRVALKVLPFAAALDPKQLQRFKNEAHAAAQLHHTNIVPVFGIGCERGVHYYAMQYIEGQTLATLISDLRRLTGRNPGPDGATTIAPSGLAGRMLPGDAAAAQAPGDEPQRSGPHRSGAAQTLAGNSTLGLGKNGATEGSLRSLGFFQAVAQLGIQAAEALEHAHQLGVVHRDIKPGNLLVEGQTSMSTPAVRLWVADFGLAHMHSQAGLTMTGDLVGTLRYMSPEQALAKRVPIDHRTDIYSLGATLYELLTLEPVFPGRDRQELLRQIAFEEPQPPRRLNRAIPAELETIVLKAMEKNPGDRYATAQELADDLDRFLKDEPIRARRPSPAQRLTKWIRRHKPLVRAFAATVLVVIVAAAVVVWREMDRIAAENAQALAETARLKTAYDKVDHEYQRAVGNLRGALDILDDFHLGFAERHIKRDPTREKEYHALLKNALRFYERFARDNSAEATLTHETCRALGRVASIKHELGQHREAENAFAEAISRLEKLNAESPGVANYRTTLAKSYNNLGLVYKDLGDHQKAEKNFLQAMQMHEESLARFDRVDDRIGVANACYNVGLIWRENKQPLQAVKWFQKALDIQQQVVKQQPAETRHWRKLGLFYNGVGLPFFMIGQFKEAEQAFRQAIHYYEKLVQQFPGYPDCDHELAATYGNLANVVKHKNPDEGQKYFQLALKRQERLVAAFPKVTDYQSYLGATYNNLGIMLSDTNRLDQAEAALRKALDLRTTLVNNYPQLPDYESELGGTLNNLARVLLKRGQHEEACRLFAQAIVHQQKALKQNPRHNTYRQFLFDHLAYLTNALISRKEYERARKWFPDLIDLCKARLDDSPKDQARRQDLAAAYRNCSLVLFKLGQLPQACEALGQAVPLLEQLMAEFPGAAQYRKDLCHCLKWMLALSPNPATGDVRRAVQFAQRAADLEPLNVGYRHLSGVAQYRARNWAAAISALSKSTELRKGGYTCDALFFLAMAHWQLGKKEQARTFYDAAANWMEKNDPNDQYLRSLRAEAAALLELPAHGQLERHDAAGLTLRGG
jgi:eukaryotic-like serine/threonine-protein kinase